MNGIRRASCSKLTSERLQDRLLVSAGGQVREARLGCPGPHAPLVGEAPHPSVQSSQWGLKGWPSVGPRRRAPRLRRLRSKLAKERAGKSTQDTEGARPLGSRAQPTLPACWGSARNISEKNIHLANDKFSVYLQE